MAYTAGDSLFLYHHESVAAMPKESKAIPSRFASSQGLFLMRMQQAALRGLHRRWDGLQKARSVDTSLLQSQCDVETTDFARGSEAQLQQQRLELHHFVTRWDESIDDWIGRSELQTLESSQNQQRQLAKLKSQWKDSQNKQKSDYDANRQRLQQELETAKQNAMKTRDGWRRKLDNEKSMLDQSMHEAREWVGIKTANPVLINWTAHDTPINAERIQAIQSLSEIAKSFEESKKQMLVEIQRMEAHPATRFLSLPMFIVIGLALGSLATGITYSMTTPPLVWGAVGLATAIIGPAVMALAASPWINRTLHRLFPPIVAQEKEAHWILQQGRKLVEQSCQTEVTRAERQWVEDAKKLEAAYQSALAQLKADYERNRENVVVESKHRRVELAQARISGLQKTDHIEKPKLSELQQLQRKQRAERKAAYDDRMQRLQAGYQKSQAHAVARWTAGIEQFRDRNNAAKQGLAIAYPDWNAKDFEAHSWDRSPNNVAWPIGTLQPTMAIPSDHPDPSGLQELLNRMQSLGDLPIAFDLIGHGSLILESDPGTQESSHRILRQVLLRAVTSLPAGGLQTTIIDPEGLGKNFSWLMHLADVDPSLVNHRVWTQPIHIADQLALAARHVEDVIQQSLRNRYRNLVEYNAQAGPMAIPYRMIVWAGFPFGLDDHSWQSLCSILSSGGRCGVGVILQLADHAVWPSFADRRKISKLGLHVRVTNPTTTTPSPGFPTGRPIVRVESPVWSDFPLTLAEPPDESQLSRIMIQHLRAAEQIGKRIVPFQSIAPAPAAVQSQHTYEGLEIPIGISDAGRIQSISLGAGTSQHVLIAGKTGSGKSSLLHTLISSAALQYSPDELRLVLLDFKKGVEFQVYAELKLAHADIIGIESKREFGLSTLEVLDRLLSARGEAFRAWGVQDLPTLKKKHPDVVLPRILIVIDEFQELFVEDDKLSQQASMLMDRIVRQGRSFGMHLILASQTLGGAYSLPRTTLSQMAVRIALQCDSSDAMLILSEDNPAAERLRHSGQGIYNEIGGRPEGNQNFQVSFLPKSEQLERLGSLPQTPVPCHPTTNALGRRIVFEGHKPAKWDHDTLAFAFRDVHPVDPSSVPWVLGNSVSIAPPVIRPLTRSAGRNAMIVANEESVVASLIGSWLAGWVQLHAQASESAGIDNITHLPPVFWILDGSRPEDTQLQSMLQWGALNAPVRIATSRELKSMIKDLSEELGRRMTDPDIHFPSLYFVVLNLSRFRELRRSEEFSFAATENDTIQADAVLNQLLADGPPVGLHVCLCADSASSLARWLSRSALRDIELRVLTQMSSSDSNQLIDSNAANRLDRYLALAHDDADGKSIQFRPFLLDSIINTNRDK
jgi:DNA segregation ATPase FtsK/SpoIIIE, S-DNA-T family